MLEIASLHTGIIPLLSRLQKVPNIFQFLLFRAEIGSAAAQKRRMLAMQVVVKGRLGQFVMPVGFAGNSRVNRCCRHRRRAQVQQTQPCGAGRCNIIPQAAQIIELVAAAGIGKGQGVEIVGGKNSRRVPLSTAPFNL